MAVRAEPDLSEWPDVLRRVAEACGLAAALTLARSHGGRELYVPLPEGIDEGHPLAQTLGLATARKAASVLSHGKLIIPMGPFTSQARRKVALRKMKAEGRTIREQAAALGLHQRTVERHHQNDREAGTAAPGPQPSLFDQD